MGQFKPMVKMMTTEPSVILKLKKGGKVEHKAGGGYMPMQSTMPAQMPAGMPARGGMAPAASPMRPSMAARRRAMNPNLLMKKGGEASCETVEKELKEHEGKPASKAHKGMKHGGKMATGGVINGQGGYKKGGGVAGDGIIKTQGQGGEFRNTKMNTAKTDHSPAKTGDVKLGNGGGYKNGGMAMVKKDGKMVPAFAADGKGKMKNGGKAMMNGGMMGGYKMGGNVNYENRPANTSKPGVSNTTTGGVKNGNGGGFKMGGRATKKAFATGGQVVDDGKAEKMPRHAISRPVANNLQSGTFAKGGKVEKEEKPNLRLIKTHTGPKGHVAKVYKDRDYGEHRVKFFDPDGKHRTDSDYHTDDVGDAHDTAQGQLNRYNMGGKAKFAEGGSEDMSKGAYDRHYANEKKENEAMRESILGAPKRAYEAVKGMLTSTPTKPPAGSVTKTEKSVTVAPKKRGGMMC